MSIGALVLYAVISLTYFGTSLVGHFTTRYSGTGTDPTTQAWFLNWWPYALLHGLNPFIAQVIWAPYGVNLTWTQSMAGLALIGYPLTATMNVIAAYNSIALAGPALAAFGAFLLAMEATDNWVASLFCGYLFGFSSYEVGQMVGHIMLTFVGLVPLIVYVVVRAYRRSWRIWHVAIVLGVMFAVQFLISVEVTTMLVIFGGCLALLAAILLPGFRVRTRKVATGIALGGVVSGILVSPFLWVMLKHPISAPPNATEVFSTDLLNLMFPTPVTWLGATRFAPLANKFTGNYAEEGAYLGLPLIALVGSYVHQWWPTRIGKVLILGLLFIIVCSLGPYLHVAGIAVISLPWRLVENAPILGFALPARFMLFAWLLVAVVAAQWMASSPTAGWAKALLALATIAFLVPNPAVNWSSPVPNVPFFATGEFRRYIQPGESVLIFPFNQQGQSMAYQMQSGMYFRMPEGYVGTIPLPFATWPFVSQMAAGELVVNPSEVAQVRAYLGAYTVGAVVVAPPISPRVIDLLARVGLGPGVAVGGVRYYRVPPSYWARYRDATPGQAANAMLAAQFQALFRAAQASVRAGRPRSDIFPQQLERGGYLDPGYGAFPRGSARWNWTKEGGWVGPWGQGVGVGIVGSWSAVSPIVRKYQRFSSAMYFPYPTALHNRPPTTRSGLLIMVFPTAVLSHLSEVRQ